MEICWFIHVVIALLSCSFFPNGDRDNIVNNILSKSSKFCVVWVTQFCSNNFTSFLIYRELENILVLVLPLSLTDKGPNFTPYHEMTLIKNSLTPGK